MSKIEEFHLYDSHLKGNRTVRVYLPGGYEEGQKSYPILYMQDGQNIFSDRGAFGDCSWKVKDILEQMETEGFGGLIVVGVDNIGERRFEDYSPWKNTMAKSYFPAGAHGGEGEAYVDFLMQEVLPFIKNQYRIKQGASNTGIAGSSMGGLISAYAAARHPDVFHRTGVFSLASWFAEEPFLQYLDTAPLQKEQKFFVRVGTEESSDAANMSMPQIYLDNSLHYVWKLLERGIPAGQISFGIGAGEIHSEKSWSAHMRECIEFLYGE